MKDVNSIAIGDKANLGKGGGFVRGNGRGWGLIIHTDERRRR